MTKAVQYFETDMKTDGFPFGAYSRSDVKEALGEMSQLNCAYCEADYDVTEPVDVEHFRPKGGFQRDGALVTPGYWWLAAVWDNLLPSCIRCNREEHLSLYDGTKMKLGKGNNFPLADEAGRAAGRGGEAGEVALLIDPTQEDPSLYIRFDEDRGRCIAVPVEQDSQSLDWLRARTSIDTYGLNRSGLVRARSRYLKRAKFALAQLKRGARRLDRLPADAFEERQEASEDVNDALDQLRDMTTGDDRFSGMVTALVAPRLAELQIVL